MKTDIVERYIEEFVSNLSPSGGEIVSGNPVFSWTGVDASYWHTFSVTLDDDHNNRLWEEHKLSTTTVRYSGPALNSGSTYYYSIFVRDLNGNISIITESFVYDFDGDGIFDDDNCPDEYNPGQADSDGDGPYHWDSEVKYWQ